MAEKRRKSRGADWDEVTPVPEGKKFDSDIETYNFSETTHSQIRLLGKVFAVKMHWVPTIRKDGSRSQFPKLCLHNIGENESCPYCECGIKVSTRYMSNAIIRDLEEARPKKATYDSDAEFKKPGDDNWTPVRVVSFPASVMQKILNFKSLTKVKTKDGIKTFHVSHPKFGRDLNVKLDSSGTGSGMYDVQRESVSKLEGEEKEYLTYDIDSVYDAVETEDEALQVIRSGYDRGTFEGAKGKDGSPLVNLTEVQRLLGVSSKKKRDYEEDDDDDTPRKKKRKYEDDEEETPKKKKRKVEEDIDDDDLEEDTDDLEDEEEEPRKKKASSKKKRQEEEEDDDIELEEDDEEEEPRKKKKSKKVEEEDDDDIELEEDEEEDDEPRRPSKKSKKKSRNEDEDEDDDIELEEDDEEEEPRKKSKKRK